MRFLDNTFDKEITIPRKPRRLEAKANKLLKAKKTRRGKRGKRIKHIPQMSYRVYIDSPYWRSRKNRYFSKHGKRCSVCGKKAGTTLHHKIYDRKLYGKEPDSHLIPLCGKHHHEFHKNHDTKQDMESETNEYVHTMKQVHNSNIDDLSWI